MHIAEASADRLVIDVENVSTMHYLFLPVFRPGELQSIYFLERESENVWRYYSIVRTGINANRMIAGNESSGSIEPLRSIATSSEFPLTGSLPRRDEVRRWVS